MNNIQILKEIYEKKRLFLYSRVNNAFTGILIKRVKPKSKKEWEEYVLQHGLETIRNVRKKLIETLYSPAYEKYRPLFEKKHLDEYLKKIFVEDCWKGYKNELRAQIHFEKMGYTVIGANDAEDFQGVDFWLIWHLNENRVAVNVKSQGWGFAIGDRAKIKKQAIEKKRTIWVVKVRDNGTVVNPEIFNWKGESIKWQNPAKKKIKL